MTAILIIITVIGIRALCRASRSCCTKRTVTVTRIDPAPAGPSAAEIRRRNNEAAKRAKELAKRRELKEKAKYDLPFLKSEVGNLYALLDIAEAEYAATTNLQKQAKFLRQINSLNRQIHATEAKYNKARAILAAY